MYVPGFRKKQLSIFYFILANVVLSVLISVVFIDGALDSLTGFLISFCWSFSICATQWSGIQFLHGYIDRKISWIDFPVKKTFWQFFVFLVYSITAFIVVQFFNFYVWNGIHPSQCWPWIAKSIPYTLSISFVISLIFTTIGFFSAWKRSFEQAEKLKVEMLAYKYESLRNQINPHFFFNSLNVLSDLVYDDQELAVKFIRQLSDLFRYVLDSRDKELVRLTDELEFIRSFTFLLKTRFEDKLQIEIDVQANSEDYIVPMTLQLLVENAVKHNEVSDAFPLRIVIRRTDDFLEVENNFQPKKVGDDSKMTGLKNISQQFAFFSDRAIRILTSDETYKVRVPILKSIAK